MQVPTKRIVADVTEANPHGYVVINESDFDEAVHQEWQEPPPPPPPSREHLDQAIAALPADYDDPEYVVKAMRAHFGDLFAAADEAKVRALVKAPPPPPAAEPAPKSSRK